MKTKLNRTYGGWTDKAFITPQGIWIPKKFCLNWNESKPPSEVECDLPEWFAKKNGLWIIKK